MSDTIDDSAKSQHGGEASSLEMASLDQDATHIVAKESDPNLVDWDGPEDPENPLNWYPATANSRIMSAPLLTLFLGLKPRRTFM